MQAVGYTDEDSAGQSNIFAVEVRKILFCTLRAGSLPAWFGRSPREAVARVVGVWFAVVSGQAYHVRRTCVQQSRPYMAVLGIASVHMLTSPIFLCAAQGVCVRLIRG